MPPSGSVPPSSEAQTRRMPDRMEGGSMLGRYTIEGAIGEGGMGVVYRARDARLGRKVALKVLQAHEGDPEAIERAKRFLREARTAAALDHPNAVSIFDVGEVGEVSFIAMELVNGRSLREFVGAVGAAEPDVGQRLRWLIDAAAALSAAHAARIIHRDVKPENVMIRDDGRVKVLDFGLARRAAQPARPSEAAPDPEREALPRVHNDITFTETGQTTLTAVGTLLGTPQYMAPEQIRTEPMDARSDQFSWGVMAYELLTGELPWKGVGIHVMARILTDEPTPIRELQPLVPEGAAAVVNKALSRPPEDRYASMDDLIAALEPYSDPASRSDPRSLRNRSMAPRAIPAGPVAGSSAPPAPDNRTQRSADHVPPRGSTAPPSSAPSSDAPKTSPSPQIEVVGPPPEAPADPEPLRARGLVAAVVAICLSLGAGIGWRALGKRAPEGDAAALSSAGATASASAAASGGTSATAVTDLPDPRTAVPEALAAYRAGLAELRFGGSGASLEKAATLDPELAAAHLQCAVDAAEFPLDDAGRAHLRRAGALRDQLGERDQLLLDALAPVLLNQPADWVVAGRRLAAAVERFPRDAQLWYERGFVAQIAEGPEASAPFVERAIALDPKYAQAMSVLGQDLSYLGRFSDARRVLSGCMAVAPTYATCAQDLARVLEHEGACDDEETMARQLAAATSEQGIAQRLLARALAARGRPEAAVREALKLGWAALPAADRHAVELQDTLSLALYAGDFTAAEAAAHDIEAALEPSRREPDHAAVARRLAEIYLETGRPADAGRVAEAFLGRRDAWEPSGRAEDYAIGADTVPDLLSASLKAGTITRVELGQRRAAWLLDWERRAPPFYQHYLWPRGFASTVETEADAREALAALPPFEPLPAFFPMTLAEAAVGHAYFLGGRLDEAVAWLERAAHTCRALELPVDHTHAQLWLGMAREAKHDKESACAAYRAVRDRWGKARPRSVTAEKAAARLQALSCGG